MTDVVEFAGALIQRANEREMWARAHIADLNAKQEELVRHRHALLGVYEWADALLTCLRTGQTGTFTTRESLEGMLAVAIQKAKEAKAVP